MGCTRSTPSAEELPLPCSVVGFSEASQSFSRRLVGDEGERCCPPQPWYPPPGAGEKLQHELFPWDGTIPAPRFSVSTSHSPGQDMGGSSNTHRLQWGCSGPPAAPGNAASTPKVFPPAVLPFSSPVLNFLNIYCYSIVRLPIGADNRIAKAHFFLERPKTNANDIHCGFWYVRLDAYQPDCTPGKEMAGLFSLSYIQFNKKTCETLCVTVKRNRGLHISRSKVGSLAKLKKVENCQRKHFLSSLAYLMLPACSDTLS